MYESTTEKLDLTKINIKNEKLVKKDKKANQDNCQELKNIAYKTMLINGNDINPNPDKHNDNNIINSFLKSESDASKSETWAKLDRTEKIKRLNDYYEILVKKHSLTDIELDSLKNYIIKCLDRKCLTKSKEIIYDKEKNKITNIPYLFFNEKTRIFILKKDDKHISTIKSLPTSEKKSKAKVKTIKINN